MTWRLGKSLCGFPLNARCQKAKSNSSANKYLGVHKMNNEIENRVQSPFPTIKPDMIDRLSKEAADRTLQPQDVDWSEIHRQAALARCASS